MSPVDKLFTGVSHFSCFRRQIQRQLFREDAGLLCRRLRSCAADTRFAKTVLRLWESKSCAHGFGVICRLSMNFTGRCQLLRSVESPPARIEVIEVHLRSFRQISRERVDWCRHLQILEDLVAAGNPTTAYSEPLSRKCRCAKFGYETEEASRNAFTVIGEFKQTFCASCPARDPKRN